MGSAAWCRGGGAGGGHGGGGGHSFGGGGHYGGYGSYSGRYGRYYGGPPATGYYSYGHGAYIWHPYHYHYYPGFGYVTDSDIWCFWTVVGISAVWLIYKLAMLALSQKSLVAITLVLRNGQMYTLTLKSLVKRSRFDTQEDRNSAAHALLEQIADVDVFAGYVHVLERSSSAVSLGDTAESIWRQEMDIAEVKPDVMNIASPTNKFQADFGDPFAQVTEANGFCLVSILVSAQGIGLYTTEERGAVINELHRLHSTTIDALYFYYTPSAGESMPQSEAIGVLEKLVMVA